MIEDFTNAMHDVDARIHSKYTNITTKSMDIIHNYVAYIRLIPSRITTWYRNYGVEQVVVLEISDFQEFSSPKTEVESDEIYDLESQDMDLFDGGLFGVNSDTDSDDESSAAAHNLFDDDMESDIESENSA